VSTDLDALRRYAADHHGVVTGAAAAALGVREVKLLHLALAGELELIAGEVYRLPDAITPLTEYAEAVALAGPGAVLADDAVLAMHDLASVKPRRIRRAVSAARRRPEGGSPMRGPWTDCLREPRRLHSD
jgi:predicted transcriptional regulator of viral defense system